MKCVNGGIHVSQPRSQGSFHHRGPTTGMQYVNRVAPCHLSNAPRQPPVIPFPLLELDDLTVRRAHEFGKGTGIGEAENHVTEMFVVAVVDQIEQAALHAPIAKGMNRVADCNSAVLALLPVQLGKLR